MATILVVEDEYLIAMLLQDLLGELGCAVAGPARSVTQAKELLRTGSINGAILDISLGSGDCYPLAEALTELRVPFIFATGYPDDGIDPRFKNVPVVAKPFDPEQLRKALSCLIRGHHNGEAKAEAGAEAEG